MVFNSSLVVSVAHVSAEVWKWLACIEERLSSEQLLDLVICFPLQQLGRFTLCIWTFLCFSPPDSYYYYSSSSSSADSDDSSTAVDYHELYHLSHSD